MKNVKTILLLVIGIIFGSIIGIKASTLISSSQVIYKDNKTVDIALNDLFDELKKGKAKIAEAITAKGVTTTSDNTLEEMANNINNILNSNGKVTIVAFGNHFKRQTSLSTTTIAPISYDPNLFELNSKVLVAKKDMNLTWNAQVGAFDGTTVGRLYVNSKQLKTATHSTNSVGGRVNYEFSVSEGDTIEVKVTHTYSTSFFMGAFSWGINITE